MAYSKQQLNELLNDMVHCINIDDELFDAANKDYEELGEWINKTTEKEGTRYSVSIYPQGSFALGTVVRPTSQEDDYDLDLVCLINNGNHLSAEELKLFVVRSWLENYKKRSTDLIEKRRCWHVDYDDVPHFHMDVIPAIPRYSLAESDDIKITNKDDSAIPVYTYQGSNPKGYQEWFFTQCRKKKPVNSSFGSSQDMPFQEDLKPNKNKTKLQKEIQLLKRHRDIMFENDMENKPVSIIITTLAAQIYSGEETLLDCIVGFIERVENYLYLTSINGQYSIPNPSFGGEDFADKWHEHPERKEAFFRWVHQLKKDFNLELVCNMDRVSLGNHLKKLFGAKAAGLVYYIRGKKEAALVQAEELKVSNESGNLSRAGTITVPPNRHYGEV